jgi:valyl-tRNA synthetase
MSKSLGNSPDPIELMKKYSADGVRVGMLLCSPAGNDLLFDEGLTEQGRNFSNKIWNAFRLVKSWKVDDDLEQPVHSAEAIQWFDTQIKRAFQKVDDQFLKYRVSDALMIVYKLFWDEFSSWYLETVKPAYQKPVDRLTYEATMGFFDQLMHMLHPFMPFITEEIWQLISERKAGESLMVSFMPGPDSYDKKLLRHFEEIKEVITNIRAVRKEKNIPPKETLKLMVRSVEGSKYRKYLEPVIKKLANLSDVEKIRDEPEGAVSFIVKNVEYFVPLGSRVDAGEELKKLEEELDYTRGFLKSVVKKLGNERFVQHAPEQVVEKERQKMADAEGKIAVLEGQIKKLRGQA